MATRFLRLAFFSLVKLGVLTQMVDAAGIDYSAPYCAKPKAYQACTPDGSLSPPPSKLLSGTWPTRSIPFVIGDFSDSAFGAEKMKGGIRAALLDLQSHSDLTFYECTGETELRSYIAGISAQSTTKPAYIRFSWKAGECENDSIGYPVTSVHLRLANDGPEKERVSVSEVRLGRFDCSELDPMGITHEVLHALGFFHKFESRKSREYFTLTPAAAEFPGHSKYMKEGELLGTTVAGAAFDKTEFDYFSLLSGPVVGGGKPLFVPSDAFKNLAARVKKSYGIDIFYKISSSSGPLGVVDHDDHLLQSSCLSAGDAEKLSIIYGAAAGLKCDAFNISSVPSCKPLK